MDLFFFFFLMYLAVFILNCNTRIFVVALNLSSWAHGLSCPTACGILIPQPGSESVSRALPGGFLTTGTTWQIPTLPVLKGLLP